MTVDETMNGKVVTVKTGETVEVVLPTAVDGGYQWSLSESADVVEASPSERKSGGGGAGHAVGGQGSTTFFLKATTPGTHQVELAEARSWEHQAPVKTFAFTIEAAATDE